MMFGILKNRRNFQRHGARNRSACGRIIVSKIRNAHGFWKEYAARDEQTPERERKRMLEHSRSVLLFAATSTHTRNARKTADLNFQCSSLKIGDEFYPQKIYWKKSSSHITISRRAISCNNALARKLSTIYWIVEKVFNFFFLSLSRALV